MIQAVSCNAAGGKSANELAAEQTLQAIYAEETAQAEKVAPEAEAPASPKAPLLMPGEPPEPERTLEDADSSIRAYENRAVSGDKFLDSLYERPFTSQEMIYQPDLDIYTVDFASDDDFFYFTITLNGMNPDEWGLNGLYGVEFDRTKTGRGDLIVWAEDIQSDWSMENVSAYMDSDSDVGGPKPIVADAGFSGGGYDTQIDLEEDKVAFARISPDDPEAVQIAVSRSLLENPAEFLWGAWADNGLRDVTMFDYNDTMGPGAAGSPINTDADYPLKALYNLDNTCRLPYGFEQMGASYPGMCISQAPATEPASGGGCTPYCIRYYLVRPGCAEWGCR
ncbi:MAG: hypothetical protein Q7J07_09880 [Pelolinea sp.]|nr:hypothetical protein [Pelolinea sp.]